MLRRFSERRAAAALLAPLHRLWRRAVAVAAPIPAHTVARRARAVAVVVLLPLLVGLGGAWLGIHVGSRTTTDMGPFEVRLDATFGSGETEIGLPPFGRVTADTHTPPLRFRATLVDVRISELTDSLGNGGARGLARTVEEDALSALLPYSLRVLAVAGIGSLAMGLLVFRRHLRSVAVAVGGTLLVVGALQLGTWQTFRPEAFQRPAFSGTLELAPQLIGDVQEVTGRIDDFRGELERVLRGAVHAYAGIETGFPGGEDQIRVLHISDIHLSPIGLDFALQLARGFDVDFVLDTGDLTHFGTPPERLILGSIERFGRPYVFVRGNHDSMELQEEMRDIPNAVVLDGEAIEIEGLTVYGQGHPVFTEDAEEELDHAEYVRRARAAGAGIARQLTLLDEPVDAVAVHDARMAEILAGRVPLVLAGHLHRPSATMSDGTLFLRVGSTGASGINVFDAGVPFGAKILYFERSDPPRLVGWDLVEQSPESASLNVQRRLVENIPTGDEADEDQADEDEADGDEAGEEPGGRPAGTRAP